VAVAASHPDLVDEAAENVFDYGLVEHKLTFDGQITTLTEYAEEGLDFVQNSSAQDLILKRIGWK